MNTIWNQLTKLERTTIVAAAREFRNVPGATTGYVAACDRYRSTVAGVLLSAISQGRCSGIAYRSVTFWDVLDVLRHQGVGEAALEAERKKNPYTNMFVDEITDAELRWNTLDNFIDALYEMNLVSKSEAPPKDRKPAWEATYIEPRWLQDAEEKLEGLRKSVREDAIFLLNDVDVRLVEAVASQYARLTQAQSVRLAAVQLHTKLNPPVGTAAVRPCGSEDDSTEKELALAKTRRISRENQA